ncbi:MAG: dTMP kinase [Actinomycetota bacterium]
MTTGRQSLFLVLEGLDGAGTTTIAGLVATELRARDLQVCLTAEPTDGPLGSVLRAHVKCEINLDPQTAALVFTGDRADHLDRMIRPALRRGQWVVCDRYLLSTLAYQGAEGVARETVMAASARFDIPDLTVVLDVPEKVRAERLATRSNTDRYEDQELSDVLRKSYEESIALLRAAGHRIDVVDASLAPEMVLADVIGRLDLPG